MHNECSPFTINQKIQFLWFKFLQIFWCFFSTTCWSMWRLSIEEDGSVVGDIYELAGNFYTLYFFYLKHCKAYLLHASCFTARSLTSKCLKGYSRTKWQQKAWKGKPYRPFGAHLLKLLVLATQIFVQELELLLSIICTMATQKRFKNFLLCLVPEWPLKVPSLNCHF